MAKKEPTKTRSKANGRNVDRQILATLETISMQLNTISATIPSEPYLGTIQLTLDLILKELSGQR
jgi:hypothetical protein